MYDNPEIRKVGSVRLAATGWGGYVSFKAYIGVYGTPLHSGHASEDHDLDAGHSKPSSNATLAPLTGPSYCAVLEGWKNGRETVLARQMAYLHGHNLSTNSTRSLHLYRGFSATIRFATTNR